MNNNYQRFLLFLLLVLLLVFLGIELSFFSFREKIPLQVHFLDVGQGDSTLIQYLDNYQILIDGGPQGRNLLSQLSGVIPSADRTIELVILTHPDKDHLAGLVDVLETYSVKAILHNGQQADTKIYQQYQEVVQERGVTEYVFGEGSEISLGDNLKLQSFNPDSVAEIKSDRNENSVVLRLDYGENSFLFTGDADFSSEQDMMSDEENIDVDWLKVGHHGSKNSTSEEFLGAVTPKWAIISAGKANRYGHPHDDLLGRLKKAGSEILRTDESGNIAVVCFNPKEECVLKEDL